MSQLPRAEDAAILSALAGRSIVLVGMMGAGKTSVGKRLAARLSLPFVDTDAEIEAGAQMSVPEIFERFGEPYFREGERKVISRLLRERQCVLATGGGAFMNPLTREDIARHGVSIWLKPEFEVLMRRVRKRSNRPLLRTSDPEGTLRMLINERSPTYALADITVDSADSPHEVTMELAIRALNAHLAPTKAAQSRRVPVPLPGRAYDVLIGPGLLDEAGAAVAKIAPRGAAAVVTDETVAPLYLARLTHSLEQAGLRVASVVCPPGESSKSYAEFARVCDALLEARIERKDVVVALGGGVVGDLAGFAAACLRRGVRFVQVPTTLLAQVDSSVGGKTGVNSPLGKNLVGAFHQPSLVIADTRTLDSLSPRQFRAGYAEVVKYGLVGDRGFFERLEARWRDVFAGGDERLHAIETSVAAKARLVVEDETEQGERALLNLGHTFAHAFERLTGYDATRLVHGEAVSVGLCLAFRFSRDLELCTGQDAQRVEAHLQAVGLPTRMKDIPGLNSNAETVLDAMRQDKKVVRGRLTFILTRGVGEAFVAKEVDEGRALAFLNSELAGG